MCVVTVPLGIPARVTCALAVGCLLGSRAAQAFPITDPDNPSIVSNAPTPSESDLRHQLQMHSGFGAAAAGGGWTFTPAISGEEIWTDNILNTKNNRRWDLLTIAVPSIAITGDTPNAQVQFQYGPQFRLAARTPQENSITNQLSGTGLFTIVPDEFYVDARAVAGGAPVNGGYGGVGLGVNPNFGTLGTTGTAGLSNQNQIQTNSFTVSPYWLHRFGDTGTAKVGYQFGESIYSQGGNSYVPLFFPTGTQSSYTVTNEGVAQFETGERFAPFRDLVVGDARLGTGNFQGNSYEYTFLNKLGYLVNREIEVFGELGYEDLQYSGTPTTHVNDVIWGVGTTWTPNPDSQVTVGFGHRYGENNVQFNGWYAVTARTRITGTYTTGLQTDLLGVQGQLDLTSLDSLGQTVNSQTGAPTFIGTGGFGAQSGLYRIKSFTAGASTVFDRDQVSIYVQVSQTTTLAAAPVNAVIPSGIIAPPVGSTNNARTVYATWTHQISDDLLLSTSGSFSINHYTTTGSQQSLAIGVGMSYLISQTLAARLSYAFFDRLVPTQGTTVNNQSYYQNLVLVGLTKQF
jgi:uncharacterized protein (PEP-CTERM system associated)